MLRHPFQLGRRRIVRPRGGDGSRIAAERSSAYIEIGRIKSSAAAVAVMLLLDDDDDPLLRPRLHQLQLLPRLLLLLLLLLPLRGCCKTGACVFVSVYRAVRQALNMA